MEVKQLNYQHHANAPYFFKDLSFHLTPGQLHALHGKNGTGKTILLNILNQKSPPQAILSGEIKNEKRSLLVNQRFDQMLADQFTFEENLKFASMSSFPKFFGGFKEVNLYADFFERFNIKPNVPVYRLSGGQRQILALLMALQKPLDLLLLDEPTATLDEENAKLVFEFLASLLHPALTLLVVCHDQSLVRQYTTGNHLHLHVSPTGERLLKVEDAV